MFDVTSSLDPAKPLQQNVNYVAAVNTAGGLAATLGPDDSVYLRRRFKGLPVTMFPRLDPKSQLFDHLHHHLKSAGLLRNLILFSPDAPCARQLAQLGAVPILTPGTIAELDLTQGQDAQRRAMHKKWRNRLHKAEGCGLRVSVAPLPTDRTHRLLAQDQVQAKQRMYRNWPPALTIAYAAANPGQAVLFTASQSRTRMAEILILLHGTSATYHIGHISPAGKALCAHNLLMDHAATWLTERGIQRLDLGVINHDQAPGLARFKLGMGAQARQLGGTWAWWPPLGRSLRGLARLDRRRMAG